MTQLTHPIFSAADSCTRRPRVERGILSPVACHPCYSIDYLDRDWKRGHVYANGPLHERSEVYDKRNVWSKNHSGCLETLCHVRGPLRNKMATLVVIPSRSDGDPSADPVPDQTLLPTLSLTESDIPGDFLIGWL